MNLLRKINIVYLLHRCFPAIYSFLTEHNRPAATYHTPARRYGPPRWEVGPRSSPAGYGWQAGGNLVGATQPGLLPEASQGNGRSAR